MSIIDSDKVDGMGIHNEGRTLAMLISFQYEPVKSCIKLLDYFNKQLEEMAIVVDFMVA